MILATYQPYVRNSKERTCDWNELEKYLGYEPIFCFPANTAQEAIIYSVLAAPNNPEKLIIFETNEFVELDIVQWNRKIAMEYQSSDVKIPIQDCFNDKPKKYKEYIVEKIDNIIEEVDIKQAFFDNYLPASDATSPAAQLLLGLAKNAKNTAEHLCNQFKIPFNQNKPWGEYSIEQKLLIKEIFQYTFLPLLHPAVLGNSFFDSNCFDFTQYINDGTSRGVSLFYNPNEDIKYKTYDFYDSIFLKLQIYSSETHLSSLQKAVDKTKPRKTEKINPNAPCPCGSGKKYKKCCRQKIDIR